MTKTTRLIKQNDGVYRIDIPEKSPGLGYVYLFITLGMIFFVILGGSTSFYQIRMWKLD